MGATILEYLVAREQHTDGHWHLHAYLKLSKKINTVDPHIFDFEDEDTEQMYHGNYQGARSDIDVIKYCVKEG